MDENRRLEGWKEIADYVGMKERQAQRWVREQALPIHREARFKRSIVFAFSRELDIWRQTRIILPEPLEEAAPPARKVKVRDSIQLFIGLAATLAVVLFLIFRRNAPVNEPASGRVFAFSTSEGHSPRRILLSHQPFWLAASLDGKRLFAACPSSRILSIVNTATWKVSTLNLPHEAGSLAASRDGSLYVGSTVEGITKIDSAKAEINGTFSTGGGP